MSINFTELHIIYIINSQLRNWDINVKLLDKKLWFFVTFIITEFQIRNQSKIVRIVGWVGWLVYLVELSIIFDVVYAIATPSTQRPLLTMFTLCIIAQSHYCTFKPLCNLMDIPIFGKSADLNVKLSSIRFQVDPLISKTAFLSQLQRRHPGHEVFHITRTFWC